MSDAGAQDPPRMVVLAGPNGSGKSTVTNGLKNSLGFPKLYINADDIARTELAHVADRPTRELQAAQLAEQRRQAALRNGESFAFETVLSTPAKIALIDEARTKGFVVDLIFVTTDDADINIVRIENRIQKGGHPVQPDKIRERYERAMTLLPAALLKSDNCFVFDNSVDGQAPRLVASKQDEKIELASDAPPWVEKRVDEPLLGREASRAACLIKARTSAPGALIEDADVGHGASYSGTIIGMTNVHVLQRPAGSVGRFVLHDRCLCAPQSFEIGKASVITYAFGPDGKHRGSKTRQNRDGPF